MVNTNDADTTKQKTYPDDSPPRWVRKSVKTPPPAPPMHTDHNYD